jgi:hypothetical protein
MKRLQITIKRDGRDDEVMNISLKNKGVINCNVYHKNIENQMILNSLSMGVLDVETNKDFRWKDREILNSDVVEIRFYDDDICDEPDEVTDTSKK